MATLREVERWTEARNKKNKDLPDVTGGVVSTPPQTSAIAGGAFEGASIYSRELATWNPSSGSADDDVIPAKDISDRRVKDSVRNDGFVSSALNGRMDSIVGPTYQLNSKPANKILGLDEVWSKEFQEEVESLFTLWAESQFCYVDATRHNTLSEIARLSISTELMYGEFLAVAQWIDDEPDRTFKTCIKVVDPDRLKNPLDSVQFNKDIIGGVEKNENGRPIAYYIRNHHPNDPYKFSTFPAYTRVPAVTDWGRQNVIHIFSQSRADQTRGISEMVSGLKELRVMRSFRDVVLQNAVINATFAAVIESDLDTGKLWEALGAGPNKEDDFINAVQGLYKSYLGSVQEYTKDNNIARLNGARIPHLLPGSKLHLQPAAQGGPLGTDFETSLLRYLAASLGISYEQLAHDYTKTNYSSARAAMNETFKSVLVKKRFVADRVSTAIYTLWLEEAINRKLITSMPRNAPSFYEGLNKEAYSKCSWIGASRGQIDELKETQAAVLRVNAGLSTREDEASKLGKDWRETYAQIAREQELQKRLGITIGTDSTNMINAVSGTPRDKTPKDATGDDSEDNTNT